MALLLRHDWLTKGMMLKGLMEKMLFKGLMDSRRSVLMSPDIIGMESSSVPAPVLSLRLPPSPHRMVSKYTTATRMSIMTLFNDVKNKTCSGDSRSHVLSKAKTHFNDCKVF